MVVEEFGWFGGIYERKILFRIKKTNQAGFKGIRTEPRDGRRHSKCEKTLTKVNGPVDRLSSWRLIYL